MHTIQRVARSTHCASGSLRAKTTVDKSPETARRVSLAVSRAKMGDREALRDLYVIYAGNVYGYVRSILHDDHEAEDVTQQVFTKLITHLDRYDECGAPFFSWLARMAHNVAIDHLRRDRLVPTECVLDHNVGWGLDRDPGGTVQDALATLPADQREVVFLRHIVGLTPGEIADHLGKTESSVHGLHHRGRRALQRELADRGSMPAARSTRHLLAA